MTRLASQAKLASRRGRKNLILGRDLPIGVDRTQLMVKRPPIADSCPLSNAATTFVALLNAKGADGRILQRPFWLLQRAHPHRHGRFLYRLGEGFEFGEVEAWSSACPGCVKGRNRLILAAEATGRNYVATGFYRPPKIASITMILTQSFTRRKGKCPSPCQADGCVWLS